MLRAAAHGDSQARSTFVELYTTAIRGFLGGRWRRRPLADEIDDAVQEIFVECFKVGGVLERADAERGHFRGLLYGVVRNVARRMEERALDHGRIRPDESAWIDQLASDDAGQTTLFDQSWARGVMRESMNRMLTTAQDAGEQAVRRCELLQRRFGDGESIRDIAAEWKVPAQHLHNDYRKARGEFYRSLREVVAFHASSTIDIDAECRRLISLLSAPSP